MEAIKYYVKGAFVGVAETPEVLEQQEELIADLTAKVADLVSEGRSQDEALGMAIASMGDLSGLVREFAAEETVAPAMFAAKPERTVEAYTSKLRLHVVVLSAGIPIAVLFVLSLLAALYGVLNGLSAFVDLLLGIGGLVWIGRALRDFHEEPDAVETVTLGGKRLRRATLQWVAICGLALFINLVPGVSGFWAWTVWIGAFAWPLSVLTEHELLATGRFVHPRPEPTVAAAVGVNTNVSAGTCA